MVHRNMFEPEFKVLVVNPSDADRAFEFTVPDGTSGKQLLDKYIEAGDYSETQWCGLQYVHSDKKLGNIPMWIEPERKIHRLNIAPLYVVGDTAGFPMYVFNYGFQYFPVAVDQELMLDESVSMLFNQVKRSIFRGHIECSDADTMFQLAAYASQALYGDYNQRLEFDKRLEHYMDGEVMPTNFTRDQCNQQWVTTLTDHYHKLKGMNKNDAKMEYLLLAQTLHTYGVTYFEVRANLCGNSLKKVANRKRSVKRDYWLGVHARGVNIYKVDNKVIPFISIPWDLIRLSYSYVVHSKLKLLFKSRIWVTLDTGKRVELISLSIESVSGNRVCRQIKFLCRGNKNLFKLRQSPPLMDKGYRIKSKVILERKQAFEDRRYRRSIDFQKLSSQEQHCLIVYDLNGPD